jgi:triosephosphate isomerase
MAAENRVRVAVCPPFTYLAPVSEVLRGSNVALGAQNLYPEKEGPFTDEVSPDMLVDLGVRHVILGHRERRHKFGETDSFINRKVIAALAAGLEVILCVGETLEERQSGKTYSVLATQVQAGLAGVAAPALAGW